MVGEVVTSMASAADSFPEKPVTLMIGFRAGGGMDTTASVLIPEIEKALGQPVVKSLQPGGGGAKAASILIPSSANGWPPCFRKKQALHLSTRSIISGLTLALLDCACWQNGCRITEESTGHTAKH